MHDKVIGSEEHNSRMNYFKTLGIVTKNREEGE
jgi:hypothetical protein